MSEEDVIDIIKNLSIDEYEWYLDSNKYQGHNEEISKIVTKAIQCLLDLYQAEKEKNKKLDEKFRYAVPDDMISELYISKDKIREIFNKYSKQCKIKNVYWYEIKKDLQELLKE